MTGGKRIGRRVLLGALRHRGAVAAVLAGAAVLTGVQALAPEPGATRLVLVAAHDLAWGEALAAGDVRRVALPVKAVPDGALADRAAAVGRVLAGPVRRGEALTDLRLVGPALLAAVRTDQEAGDPELVAAPVRIADAGAAALLRAGDRVDVLAAPGDEEPAAVVAPGVRVLAVPPPDASGGGVLAEGALVVLATSREVAARLARATTTSRLSILLRAA